MIFAVFDTPIFKISKIRNFRAPNGASLLNPIVLANENSFFTNFFKNKDTDPAYHTRDIFHHFCNLLSRGVPCYDESTRHHDEKW